MRYELGFPKTLVHPSYMPAILDLGDSNARSGRPARFLPVMAHTPDDEESYRAQGYLLPGEAPARNPHLEYPKMMRHPEHEDAVQAVPEGPMHNGHPMWPGIPAKAEVYPDKIVETAQEEREWLTKGYLPGGVFDEHAYERAHSLPEVEYRPEEYPKWVDSGRVDKNGDPIMELVQDPRKLSPQEVARKANEYPKHVELDGQTHTVYSPEQEAALRRGEHQYVSPRMTHSDPITQPRPAPPGLDVDAIKGAIIRELMPQIRDAIQEVMSVSPKSPKRQWTEAQKQAARDRMAAARSAKQRKRHGQDDQRAQSDAGIQRGEASQRIEEGTEGFEP